MTKSRELTTIFLDDNSLGYHGIGELSHVGQGVLSAISFEYQKAWLESSDAFELDPGLQLYPGKQYFSSITGILSDMSPDRWGRTLMERRESILARHENRKPRQLDDWDFLLGVNDAARMGSLRLKNPNSKGYFSEQAPAAPPSTYLREMEALAKSFENGEQGLYDDTKWLAMLFAPGSSLGGARPKASFLDTDSSLWIAKFPSKDDRIDVGAWEYVMSKLASLAGVEVPAVRLLRLNSNYHTFCSKRFDRIDIKRILYASAMTLAVKRDGEDASYLDIAQAIERSAHPTMVKKQLEALFRRVVFNVLSANRDDHLRNHGFLRTTQGWHLAPAFDMNPTLQKLEHALTLDDALKSPDLQIVMETASFYRLSAVAAKDIVAEVKKAVGKWREFAIESGISKSEIDVMGMAFEPTTKSLGLR